MIGYNMKDYKRDLQLCMLEMIRDIDKICRKNNIEYYLSYGSCLGAVRHQGFIPWDDDFDIMLKYDQYQKFIQVCEDQLDKKKYFVQTPESEKNYYLSFAKIRNIKTTLIEEGNKNEDIIRGVYIDVFPLVGCPAGKLKRKLLEINRALVLSANRNIINNKFLYFIFKLILKIFGKESIINYCTKQCIKYNCSDYSEVCSVFDGDSFQIGKTTNKILGKPKYVQFENLKLPIPEHYDQYLTNIYGNYMKIPTHDEIVAKEHTPYFLDLNLPYEEYKKKRDSYDKD